MQEMHNRKTLGEPFFISTPRPRKANREEDVSNYCGKLGANFSTPSSTKEQSTLSGLGVLTDLSIAGDQSIQFDDLPKGGQHTRVAVS